MQTPQSDEPPLLRNPQNASSSSTPREPPEILESEPKLVELLSNFLISQGISLDASKDATFQDLITYINPNCEIPEENLMMEYVEKRYSITKPLINYPKTISVTIDVFDDSDKKFLAFSFHYFENFYERKSVVYLKKLSQNQITAADILSVICSNISPKISNLVVSNPEILELIGSSEQYHMCFYYNMTNFVTDLLKIEEFSNGIDILKKFIQFIESDTEVYYKFKRFQLSKNQEFDLPSIGNDSWESTYIFLTKCLVLHESLSKFCVHYEIEVYINNETFNHLIHLQRLLQQCSDYCRSISTSSSSISEIIPAIEGLRRLIDMEFPFQREKIQNLLDSSFKDYSESRYEKAVLLDPRYSYSDNFADEKWVSLEHFVFEEFVNTDWKWAEPNGIPDATSTNSEKRIELIDLELSIYRQLSVKERPGESDCPFRWWVERQLQFKFLPVMAREYLSCPAISIDASHYFSESGKFRRFTRMYSGDELEKFLNLAGPLQEFRGKGASEDGIFLSAGIQNDLLEVKVEEPDEPMPEVKLEPLDTDDLQFDITIPEPKYSKKVYNPPSTNRQHRCHICSEMKSAKDVIHIKRDCDSLIILVACLYLESIDFQQAERLINLQIVVVCRSHIPEIVEEIYGRLGFKNRKDLYDCSMDRLQSMLVTVKRLIPEMTVGALRNVLTIFFRKFEKMRVVVCASQEVKPPVIKEDSLRIQASSESINPVSIPIPKQKSRNRRCYICKELKSFDDSRSIVKASRRLLIIVACIYRKSMTMEQAGKLMKASRLDVCVSHIEDTIDEIYEKLCLTDIRYLNSCSIDRIQNMLVTVTMISPEMTAGTLRDALFDFLDRFEDIRDNMQKKKGEASTSSMEKRKADSDEDFVVKKNPRKSAAT